MNYLIPISKLTEYFDILSPEGKPTGKIASRDFIHKTGLWHGSIHVWVFDINLKRFLLQKRSQDKESYPGLLDVSASGHVDAGEDYISAALRETNEEIGLDLKESDLVKLGDQKLNTVHPETNFISNEFNSIYIYIARLDSLSINFDKNEIESVSWYSVEEIDQLFTSNQDITCISELEWKKVKDYLLKKFI